MHNPSTSAHPAHGSEKPVAFGGWFFFVCASGRLLLPAEARFGGAPIFPHQTLASFLHNPSNKKAPPKGCFLVGDGGGDSNHRNHDSPVDCRAPPPSPAPPLFLRSKNATESPTGHHVGAPSARLRKSSRLMRLLFLRLCSGTPPFPHATRSAGLAWGPHFPQRRAASFCHAAPSQAVKKDATQKNPMSLS